LCASPEMATCTVGEVSNAFSVSRKMHGLLSDDKMMMRRGANPTGNRLSVARTSPTPTFTQPYQANRVSPPAPTVRSSPLRQSASAQPDAKEPMDTRGTAMHAPQLAASRAVPAATTEAAVTTRMESGVVLDIVDFGEMAAKNHSHAAHLPQGHSKGGLLKPLQQQSCAMEVEGSPTEPPHRFNMLPSVASVFSHLLRHKRAPWNNDALCLSVKKSVSVLSSFIGGGSSSAGRDLSPPLTSAPAFPPQGLPATTSTAAFSVAPLIKYTPQSPSLILGPSAVPCPDVDVEGAPPPLFPFVPTPLPR
jgi:hypothetical protein